jgi:hypothetical protein
MVIMVTYFTITVRIKHVILGKVFHSKQYVTISHYYSIKSLAHGNSKDGSISSDWGKASGRK